MAISRVLKVDPLVRTGSSIRDAEDARVTSWNSQLSLQSDARGQKPLFDQYIDTCRRADGGSGNIRAQPPLRHRIALGFASDQEEYGSGPIQSRSAQRHPL